MTAFRDIIQARQRPATRPLAAPWRPMRQRQAARWALTAPPGQTLRGPHHRAMRLLIEALELARASGLSEAQMQALLSAAFSRDASDVRRTAGGVGVALLMLCEALNIDADEAEIGELNRMLALLETQHASRPTPAAAHRPAAPAPQARAERRQEELHEDFGHQPH
jgi:hypothetical protein